MLGAGLQFGRSRGGDRFYDPAKARRNYQNQQSQDHLRRAQSDDVTVQSQSPSKEDKSVVSKESPKPVVTPALEPVVSPLCNLERFLESITPSVPAQYLSKTTMRGWRTCDVEFRPYFVLGDLWESFKEWSAYGVGVPLILNDSAYGVGVPLILTDSYSVDQYYVPYLSAIQIYGDRLKCSVKSRQPVEDSDYFRDSGSDGSSDSEHEKCLNYSREQRNHHHLRSESQHNALQEGFSSDEGESGNTQKCLLFEYLEQDQPYGREPLADKISDLALRFPELKTLRSCDLLSSSWISVAWYPIYRIPMGPTLKDLDACFLTYHSLHTPLSGTQSAQTPVVTYRSEIDGVPRISLPVFALASYKFKESIWMPTGGCERQLLNPLLQAADKWLTLLQVNHPDFLFFHRR